MFHKIFLIAATVLSVFSAHAFAGSYTKVGEIKIGGGFVADFQPLQVDNTHEFSAALPDLALSKFHQRAMSLSRFSVAEEIIIRVVIFPAPTANQLLGVSSAERGWLLRFGRSSDSDGLAAGLATSWP